MKLTLRDLFWLVLLVAGLVVWGLDLVRVRSVRLPRSVIGSVSDHHNYHIPETRRASALIDFAQMTDDELDEYFGSLPENKMYQLAPNHYGRCHEYEPCLDEMARRGLADRLQ